MTPGIIGFLRGAGYSVLGGALFGLTNFVIAQPLLSGTVAVIITGFIAAFEHKYNIPVPTNNTPTTTPAA